MMALMPSESMHRGDQIRQARETRGWTQARLAELVSVTPRTVRNWEQTGAVPRRRLNGIDDALRVPGVDSIYRDDYPAAARMAAMQPDTSYATATAARMAALQPDTSYATDAARLAEKVTAPTIRAFAEWEQQVSILARLQAMRTELDHIITELGGEPS